MTAGKGDTPRPIVDRTQFESNWDDIFGKSKLQKAVEAEWEVCAFCGFHMEYPCDSAPNDYCSDALDKQYSKGRND